MTALLRLQRERFLIVSQTLTSLRLCDCSKMPLQKTKKLYIHNVILQKLRFDQNGKTERKFHQCSNLLGQWFSFCWLYRGRQKRL